MNATKLSTFFIRKTDYGKMIIICFFYSENILPMNRITMTIQVKNPEEQKTQADWGKYTQQLDEYIHTLSPRVLRNVASAWVIEIKDEELESIKQELVKIKQRWQQKNLTITIGKTEFI